MQPNVLCILTDRVHGFDRRLTTDIYPGDFSRPPTASPEARPLPWRSE